MAFNIRRAVKSLKFGMSAKLRFAIGTIVGLLLVTTVISILEFRRMSTHVSDLISDNITSINLSAELGVKSDEYNLRLLSSIGYADSLKKLDFDPRAYLDETELLVMELADLHFFKTDSLSMSYYDYARTSVQLDSIIASDFVDTRDWYFTVLQPKYNEFRTDLDEFNVKVYDNLKENSVSFDESFYRSIMPTIISVLAAIALCLLLQFFILSYYVRPLKKIINSLELYKHNSHGYDLNFEGDDELNELNGSISDLVDENVSLKQRLRDRES